MATARRVAQDAKQTMVEREVRYEVALVLERAGRVVERDGLGVEYITEFVSEFIPQPDRILLDLSLDEARCIQASLAFSTNSKASPLWFQLADALKPGTLTSGQETTASQNKDTACGKVQADVYKQRVERG